MRVYLDMLRYIIDNGEFISNGRTKEGYYSVFGYQNRYNLSKGFPAVTTKKLWMKGVVGELLWFLEGNINAKFLKEKYGVGIWDEWQDEDGYLGPIYGKQWTRWESIKLIPKSIIPHHGKLTVDYTPTVCGIGTPGKFDKRDPYYRQLQNIWMGILQRCYNPTRKDYQWYGAKGVHVDPRWHVFSNFQKDVRNLSGWHSFVADPLSYSLDKDYFASNRYGPETCVWSGKTQQRINTSRAKLVEATSPKGKTFVFMNANQFARDRQMDISSICACIRGTKPSYKGWTFKVIDTGNKVPRVRIINQIHQVIGRIKEMPKCRRLIVSAWNPAELEEMSLSPCHAMMQFHVMNGKLSCHLYQRSADAFLGVPFNIASYALLTHMIAQVTNLEVGEFVHTFGDLHIYETHLEQVKEQLQREPMPLPQLWLDPSIKNIDDFRPEHIKLLNYESHPTIKASVAI